MFAATTDTGSGLEIREQVCQFVTDKIAALRKQHEATSEFNNTSVLRINAMKFLPNLLEKAQLSHIFFLLCVGSARIAV